MSEREWERVEGEEGMDGWMDGLREGGREGGKWGIQEERERYVSREMREGERIRYIILGWWGYGGSEGT